MTKCIRHVAWFAGTASLVTGMILAPALAQPASDAVEAFYRGKTINMYIGFTAGDTYDIYSRIAARHLSRFIPGSPAVVPTNMPGVGSLKAANYLFSQAPQDGTAIGMAGQAIAFEQMVKNSAVSFDARQFNWIGRIVPVIQFIASWHTTPVRTIQDAMEKEIVLAATSAGAVTGTVPRLLNRLAGTRFKIVYGYPGMSGTMIAMERGEAGAATATGQLVLYGRPDLISKNLLSLLVQYSKSRNHLFPNIPAMGEFGRTDDEKRILQLYGSTAELGRAITAPPNVPADRVNVLRAAFDKMMKDPEFLGETQRAKMELDPMSGSELVKIVEDTINVPPALAQAARLAVQ